MALIIFNLYQIAALTVRLYLFSFHRHPVTRNDVTRKSIGRYSPESSNVGYTIFKFSFHISNKKKTVTLLIDSVKTSRLGRIFRAWNWKL